MDKKAIEYAVIKSAINILCVLCAAKSDMVIDALTGVLWDEEEAGGIKSSSGKFELTEFIQSASNRTTAPSA